MKLRFSFALQVCLYFGLSLGAVNQIEAAAAAGDVPAASLRANDPINGKLDTPTVALTDIAILERARAANNNVYNSLQSFICNEEINRFRGNAAGELVHALDTVTAKLSFERGVEQYTNIIQNSRQRSSIDSLTGAWSEGEFGTLLIQTQQLLATQKVTFENFSDLQGEPVAVYHFDVSVGDSPWDLSVGSRHYTIPFTTNVWISVKTGEIRKIERSSLSGVPETHISQLHWGITLDHVALNGNIWLLPVNGTYTVTYNNDRREWNQISFSGYQRYSAQTALKFD